MPMDTRLDGPCGTEMSRQNGRIKQAGFLPLDGRLLPRPRRSSLAADADDGSPDRMLLCCGWQVEQTTHLGSDDTDVIPRARTEAPGLPVPRCELLECLLALHHSARRYVSGLGFT